MSLLNLLSLDDDTIDVVTAVVRNWCQTNQASLDSEHGRRAMDEAIRLGLQGETSGLVLADKLGQHMRLEQYRNSIG